MILSDTAMILKRTPSRCASAPRHIWTSESCFCFNGAYFYFIKPELTALHTEQFFCLSSHSPSLVSDPTVSRYHVQWMPEYCSHNETRGPEKSVTQVSPRQLLTRSAQPIELWLDQQLCAMQSTHLTFCVMLRGGQLCSRKRLHLWTRSLAPLDLNCANRWLLFWILWLSDYGQPWGVLASKAHLL